MKKFYSLLIALLALVGVAQAQTITFTAGTDKGTQTDAGKGADQVSKDGITLSVTKGALAADQYRIGKNQTLTISSTVGDIQKVKFTCTASGTSQYGPGCFAEQTGYSYEGNTGTWTGSAAEVSFLASSNQVRATKIEITVKNPDPNYVAAPAITPETGTYYSAQEVTIVAEEGTTIYYTTNGGDPTISNDVYAAPFTVSETTTVKAIAVKGDNKSDVATSVITIETLQTQTIADVLTAGVGTGKVSATVVAAATNGVLVQDATGYIFVYTGAAPEVAVGDVVTVSGPTVEYGGRLQFSEDASVTKTGTATPVYPNPTVLNGSSFDALVSNVQVQYVEVEATVTSVGTYYNLTISGATNTGSLIAGSDILSQLNVNDAVKITGFFVYATGTSKKYGYIIATKVDLPQVEYTEFNTFAAAKAAAPAAEADAVNAQLNLNEAIVVFVNGQSVYLNDKEHGMLVYGTNSKNLKAGDIVSGTVKGKLYKRNGNTQVSNPVYDVNVVESGFGILPHKVAAADLLANGANYENELVLIEYLVPQATALDNRNINFDAYPDDSFDKSVGVVAVRDNWNIATELVFNEETPYAVTGFVTLYTKNDNTVVQIYPRTAADLDNGEVQPEYEFTGDGTLEKPYTAEDVRHKVTEKDVDLETQVIVKAYIVGYISGNALNANSVIFSAAAPEGKTVTESNILVADAADASTIAEVLPINLPNGFVREGLNLAANPTNLGKQVWLRGDITKYMGVSGLKDVKDYSFDGVNFTAVRGIAAEAAPAAKTIYNVAGQRMQNLNKAGLYIVNGKKVVVK